MGNYTGYRLSLRLNPSTPAEVVATLLDVIRENEPRAPLPQHPFFEQGLWDRLFSGGSSYFTFSQGNQAQPLEPTVMARVRLGRGETHHWELEGYGATKKPSAHLTLLLDWLKPWVELQAPPLLVTQYEEDTCVPLPRDPNEEVVGFGCSPEYGALARVVGLDGEGLWSGTVVGRLNDLVLPDLVGEHVLERRRIPPAVA